MANRYWVGGSGTWDATTTTNWSASSGGASGASAPTSADDVIFNSSSGAAPTVTIATTAVCGAVTITAPTSGTLTFAFGTTGFISYNGNWSSPASLFATTGGGPTAGGIVYVGSGSSTLTTNGYSFPTGFGVNTSAGTLTLGGALTSTSSLTVTQGTFTTNNYTLTVNAISSSNSNIRTINLGSSTVTLAGTNAIAFTGSTNLTLNAGTSSISCSTTNPIFNGGGKTFYNVTFTSASVSNSSITGANTFNNLTITGRTTVGINTLSISADQTISGTLTLSAGTAAAYRTFLVSNTNGTTRTLTCAAVSLTDIDFQDITIAGAASPASGTRLGDCKGNGGITFPAAKTVYYRSTGSANWSASWSATSGGGSDATQFPLAQDTAVFPAATYPASGSTTTINAIYNIGTIDMSLRTSNTMTLSITSSPAVYGNWTNGTGITLSGTAAITFAGRTTQQVTSSAITFVPPITIDSPSGSVTLQDALTATGTVTLTSGTINLQSFKLSANKFDSSNSNTRTIAFGTGSIDCTGSGTSWNTSTATNLTTTGAQVVNLTYSSTVAMTVNTGQLSEANSISFNFTGGTYALNFPGGASNTSRDVNFTGYAGVLAAIPNTTIYGNLTFSSGMTINPSGNGLNLRATSGTQTITSNNQTMDFVVTINGGSATTITCADALTLGSTRALTFSLGTLQLKSGVTSTVGSFVTSGTTLKYLQSTTSGTQATLSDAAGTNTVTYLSIQDSAATGGATFTATDATNVNAGNNSGWNFGVIPGNFFLMFN